MIKKYITTTTVILFVWIPMQFLISQFYPNYTRYFTYLSIIVMISVMIFDLIKQWKEDKINDTTEFQALLYKFLFMIVLLTSCFFILKQNYI